MRQRIAAGHMAGAQRRRGYLGAAHGAAGARAEPRVDARHVEAVRALREHPHGLALLEVREAHRARAIPLPFPLASPALLVRHRRRGNQLRGAAAAAAAWDLLLLLLLLHGTLRGGRNAAAAAAAAAVGAARGEEASAEGEDDADRHEAEEGDQHRGHVLWVRAVVAIAAVVVHFGCNGGAAETETDVSELAIYLSMNSIYDELIGEDIFFCFQFF